MGGARDDQDPGGNYRGIRKVSNSSIEIAFVYRGIRCREVVKLEPTPFNLAKAAEHRENIVRAIRKGDFDYAVTFPESKRRFEFATPQGGNGETVEEYLHRWLAAQSGLKASTLADYRKTVRLLSARFGDIELFALTRLVIKQWFDGYEATPKRLRNLQSVLRTALAAAVDDEIIESNPLFEPFRFQNRASNAPLEDEEEFERKDPFTADEQKAILGALEGQQRNLVQFALWSGMRTSELAALRWRDISFQDDTVSVRRVKTQHSLEPERPKTAAGRRTFKLLKFAKEALLLQLPFTFEQGNLDKEVFHNPETDQPWTGDQPIRKRLWVPALKRAGVRYRYPYQTRHTFASMAFASGEDERYVCQALGHRDIATTRRHYIHWMPTKTDKHGEKMEALFGDLSTVMADEK